MTTLLEHSDKIMKAPRGSWLMFCEPGKAVNMREGGLVSYKVGDKLRVKFASGGLIWCDDERARSVSMDRQQVAAVERST